MRDYDTACDYDTTLKIRKILFLKIILLISLF